MFSNLFTVLVLVATMAVSVQGLWMVRFKQYHDAECTQPLAPNQEFLINRFGCDDSPLNGNNYTHDEFPRTAKYGKAIAQEPFFPKDEKSKFPTQALFGFREADCKGIIAKYKEIVKGGDEILVRDSWKTGKCLDINYDSFYVDGSRFVGPPGSRIMIA